MNHDIAHCIGIGAKRCAACMRKKAHEEVRQLVQQSKLPSGKIINYIDPQECGSNKFLHYKEGGAE